ncbi:uncharacterized protein LODBEIA_P36640 [Lodderomyces beijingensis]|uniref:O-acyltransferase n=1 Tax=Lodderomyces beijingensis TaxID=1775926 RepID=A0ABP0ZQF9_9ASCO
MRTSTADRLDSIQDAIDKRDLLSINNEYGSSSDNDESEHLKIIKDPADLTDIRPAQVSKNGSYFRTNSEVSSAGSTASSAATTPISSSPLANEVNGTLPKHGKLERHQDHHHHHNKELKERPKPKATSSGLQTSESDITLAGLVKYVSKQDKARLNNRKKEKTEATDADADDQGHDCKKQHRQLAKDGKYKLRFSDLSFKSSNPTIFDSPEFINSQFFGFYVLFWLATAFTMMNQLVHIYFENATPFYNWVVVKTLRQDLLKVGITDLVMYLATYFSFFTQLLVKKRLLSWRRFGWIIESVYEVAFVGTVIWFVYYMHFPWIARVFLVLHSLVFLMKIHSYSFYNGYLWAVYTEGLFSESYLNKLLNDEVELPEGHELSSTLKTLEGSIEFAKYELEYQSRATTDKPENDHHKFEAARLDISIEELQKQGIIKFPQNVNLGTYFEYSMFPTLVYTLTYPRTKRIRWSYVFAKTCAVFGLFFLMITISENSLLPIFARCQEVKKLPFKQEIPQFIFILLDTIPPFFMNYLFTFFLIWDSVLNALAELTRFADREFYGAWWSCTDFSQFARLWNKPVHNFLLRHVYHSSISAFHVNKIHAALFTFILSSLVHELVMYIIFGTVRGYLLWFQMSQIPLIMLSQTKLLKGRRVLGNIICWFGFISGPSVICCLYLVF